MKIQICNLSNNPNPTYAHKPIDGKVQDSGMDIRANLSEVKMTYGCRIEDGKLIMPSLSRVLIPTGLHYNCPLGYEIQVRDRSGNALKRGLILANGIGTGDAIYRGDLGVILINCSPVEVTIEDGERIAQMVLCKVETIEPEYVNTVEELGETSRGEGGFNSTGTK